MFADDISFFISNTNFKSLYYEQGNEELASMHKWLTANKLFLNASKTNYILFRTPRSLPPSTNNKLIFYGKQIERVTTTNF